MNVFETVINNLNTWLVMLAAGVIVWLLRQVVPKAIEGTKLWRTVLRILPVVFGAVLALIPGLRPIPENLAQSAVIGIIGGSFATTTYEILREIVPAKMKAMMGGKTKQGD